MKCKSLHEFNRAFQAETGTEKELIIMDKTESISDDELDYYLDIIFTEEGDSEKQKNIFDVVSDLFYDVMNRIKTNYQVNAEAQ